MWVISWRIKNLSDRQLHLLAARLPHSQFRGGEIQLQPALEVPSGQSAVLELSVACNEAPGEVVENAFLILRVLWSGEPWRILTRFRVLVDSEGAPHTTTELITTQPVGFSEGEE